MVNKKTKVKNKTKVTAKKAMTTKKLKRARNTKGHFKADNPATPNVNEAYEQKLKEPLDFSKNKSKFTTTNIAIVAIVVIIIASVVIKVAS